MIFLITLLFKNKQEVDVINCKVSRYKSQRLKMYSQIIIIKQTLAAMQGNSFIEQHLLFQNIFTFFKMFFFFFI